MEFNIHYGNVRRSPFLEDFIRQQVERIERFKTEKAKADLWMHSDSHLDSGGQGHFTFKLQVQRPHRKDHFVKKVDRDFFQGLKRSIKTVEHALRKEK